MCPNKSINELVKPPSKRWWTLGSLTTAKTGNETKRNIYAQENKSAMPPNLGPFLVPLGSQKNNAEGSSDIMMESLSKTISTCGQINVQEAYVRLVILLTCEK